ncbi:MAG: crossover junction endodeoxyribonuclease RuvC [Rickettsia sp.]|nr:crossover junction endodeoxyribonuclease RuvC [Rickettsia sp.]
MKILGIDPSINHSGWSIIEFDTDLHRYIDGGVISYKQNIPLSHKLSKIYKFLENILRNHNIKHIAMEKSFINVNALTSMKLSYARAVVMTLAGHDLGINLIEYSPNYIKKTIVGNGHASKDQIAYFLKFLINDLPKSFIKSDHTDAIAIAYTYAKNFLNINNIST